MSVSSRDDVPGAAPPWWVRVCRVGWKVIRFFWVIFILAFMLPKAVEVLFSDKPLRSFPNLWPLLEGVVSYPIWTLLIFLWLLLFTGLFWFGSHKRNASWNDVIDIHEAACFVGREQELETFRQQINCTPPHYLIFYITGQGGVGKTTLLNRYREIAKVSSFLLAGCDELQQDVPAVLGSFAQQLAEQNTLLKRFNERYKVYRQKMDEIESDPEAPRGLADLVGRTVARATYIVGNMVPVLREGLAYLPRETIETHASEWAAYLAKKLTNKDEVALVREPTPILTSLFFEDLNEVAEKQRVLLCFDNFEATRQELQDWFLRLREYRPSLGIRIAIAGRDQPGAKWDPLRSVTKTFRLNVFTEQEAEAFLDVYKITDSGRRTQILEFSGKLPVLMSWLAAPEGQELTSSVPIYDIVELFLRWITEPAWQQVALLAAIPRSFNVDILKLLLEYRDQTVDAQSSFDWLLKMAFVEQRAGGWCYHDVVRRTMLQYQRQMRPQAYRQTHAALANFYNTRRCELDLLDNEQWANERWREDTLAYAYHFLAAGPDNHWGEIMSLFVIALRKGRQFAIRIMELLSLSDVSEELSHEHRSVVQLYFRQLQAINKSGLQRGFEMFDSLCDIAGLSSQAKGYAFAYRGECYELDGKWEKARRDFTDALYYIPENAEVMISRSMAYGLTGHYQEALKDFDRVIALDPKNAWAIANRGVTRRILGYYQSALEDFDRAIALIDEKGAYALIAHRALVYRLMGRYEEALKDFDRAIALNDQDAWIFARRGMTYRLMGSYEEALKDLSRATALDKEESWYWYRRAQILMLMGQRDAFKSCVEEAIELARDTINSSPEDWRVGFHFGLYNLANGNLDGAEAQYYRLASACSSLSEVLVAAENLKDFLAMEPSNELAKRVLAHLQVRIAELK